MQTPGAVTPPEVAVERSARRWVLLAGLIGVYFTFAVAVSSIAPMLNLVRTDLGATRGEMGFALGAWAMMFIGTAPLAGRFVDRLGIGLSIGIGGLFVSASLLARAAATGVPSLWLAIALFGIGAPLISVGAPTLVSIWFDQARERRIAVAFYTLAPGLGGVITTAITNPVLLPRFETWRRVLVAEALFALAAAALWAVIYRLGARTPSQESGATDRSPSRVDATEASAANPDRSDSAPTLRVAVRGLLASPGVKFSLATAFSIFFVNHALSAWFPAALEDLANLTETSASNWVAASGLVALSIALVVPPLTVARHQRGVFFACLGAVLLALVALALGPRLLQFAAVLAIGVRGPLVPLGILMLMDSDRVTEHNSGLANGLWFSVGEIGGVTGPLVLGLVADTGAGFSGALLTVVAVAAGVAMVAVAATDRVARRDTISP